MSSYDRHSMFKKVKKRNTTELLRSVWEQHIAPIRPPVSSAPFAEDPELKLMYDDYSTQLRARRYKSARLALYSLTKRKGYIPKLAIKYMHMLKQQTSRPTVMHLFEFITFLHRTLGVQLDWDEYLESMNIIVGENFHTTGEVLLFHILAEREARYSRFYQELKAKEPGFQIPLPPRPPLAYTPTLAMRKLGMTQTTQFRKLAKKIDGHMLQKERENNGNVHALIREMSEHGVMQYGIPMNSNTVDYSGLGEVLLTGVGVYDMRSAGDAEIGAMQQVNHEFLEMSMMDYITFKGLRLAEKHAIAGILSGTLNAAATRDRSAIGKRAMLAAKDFDQEALSRVALDEKKRITFGESSQPPSAYGAKLGSYSGPSAVVDEDKSWKEVSGMIDDDAEIPSLGPQSSTGRRNVHQRGFNTHPSGDTQHHSLGHQTSDFSLPSRGRGVGQGGSGSSSNSSGADVASTGSGGSSGGMEKTEDDVGASDANTTETLQRSEWESEKDTDSGDLRVIPYKQHAFPLHRPGEPPVDPSRQPSQPSYLGPCPVYTPEEIEAEWELSPYALSVRKRRAQVQYLQGDYDRTEGAWLALFQLSYAPPLSKPAYDNDPYYLSCDFGSFTTPVEDSLFYYAFPHTFHPPLAQITPDIEALARKHGIPLPSLSIGHFAPGGEWVANARFVRIITSLINSLAQEGFARRADAWARHLLRAGAPLNNELRCILASAHCNDSGGVFKSTHSVMSTPSFIAPNMHAVVPSPAAGMRAPAVHVHLTALNKRILDNLNNCFTLLGDQPLTAFNASISAASAITDANSTSDSSSAEPVSTLSASSTSSPSPSPSPSPSSSSSMPQTRFTPTSLVAARSDIRYSALRSNFDYAFYSSLVNMICGGILSPDLLLYHFSIPHDSFNSNLLVATLVNPQDLRKHVSSTDKDNTEKSPFDLNILPLQKPPHSISYSARLPLYPPRADPYVPIREISMPLSMVVRLKSVVSIANLFDIIIAFKDCLKMYPTAKIIGTTINAALRAELPALAWRLFVDRPGQPRPMKQTKRQGKNALTIGNRVKEDVPHRMDGATNLTISQVDEVLRSAAKGYFHWPFEQLNMQMTPQQHRIVLNLNTYVDMISYACNTNDTSLVIQTMRALFSSGLSIHAHSYQHQILTVDTVSMAVIALLRPAMMSSFEDLILARSSSSNGTTPTSEALSTLAKSTGLTTEQLEELSARVPRTLARPPHFSSFAPVPDLVDECLYKSAINPGGCLSAYPAEVYDRLNVPTADTLIDTTPQSFLKSQLLALEWLSWLIHQIGSDKFILSPAYSTATPTLFIALAALAALGGNVPVVNNVGRMLEVSQLEDLALPWITSLILVAYANAIRRVELSLSPQSFVVSDDVLTNFVNKLVAARVADQPTDDKKPSSTSASSSSTSSATQSLGNIKYQPINQSLFAHKMEEVLKSGRFYLDNLSNLDSVDLAQAAAVPSEDGLGASPRPTVEKFQQTQAIIDDQVYQLISTFELAVCNVTYTWILPLDSNNGMFKADFQWLEESRRTPEALPQFSLIGDSSRPRMGNDNFAKSALASKRLKAMRERGSRREDLTEYYDFGKGEGRVSPVFGNNKGRFATNYNNDDDDEVYSRSTRYRYNGMDYMFRYKTSFPMGSDDPDQGGFDRDASDISKKPMTLKSLIRACMEDLAHLNTLHDPELYRRPFVTMTRGVSLVKSKLLFFDETPLAMFVRILGRRRPATAVEFINSITQDEVLANSGLPAPVLETPQQPTSVEAMNEALREAAIPMSFQEDTSTSSEPAATPTNNSSNSLNTPQGMASYERALYLYGPTEDTACALMECYFAVRQPSMACTEFINACRRESFRFVDRTITVRTAYSFLCNAETVLKQEVEKLITLRTRSTSVTETELQEFVNRISADEASKDVVSMYGVMICEALRICSLMRSRILFQSPLSNAQVCAILGVPEPVSPTQTTSSTPDVDATSSSTTEKYTYSPPPLRVVPRTFEQFLSLETASDNQHVVLLRAERHGLAELGEKLVDAGVLPSTSQGIVDEMHYGRLRESLKQRMLMSISLDQQAVLVGIARVIRLGLSSDASALHAHFTAFQEMKPEPEKACENGQVIPNLWQTSEGSMEVSPFLMLCNLNGVMSPVSLYEFALNDPYCALRKTIPAPNDMLSRSRWSTKTIKMMLLAERLTLADDVSTKLSPLKANTERDNLYESG